MDFKFALRSLARAPGFTLLSILILAMGIGANSAIFSVVYGVVLRPLSYPRPEQLVAISTSWRGGSTFGHVSGPNFLDYQTSTAFRSMAAYSGDILTVAANGRAESVGATVVSPDFLKTLGVQPVVGRTFSESEFDGHPRVVLAGQRFWHRYFGNAAFSPGHILKVAGFQLEIIGLLPAPFHFPEESESELWLPLPDVLKETSRSAGNYLVVGRLKDGVGLEQAQAQLSTISQRLAKAYPEPDQDARARVTPLNAFSVRNVRTTLYVLMAAVALVLLIACANIGNLLLARGNGRLRELAIRAAIGASRARIARQLLTETLMLGCAGALGGVLLASTILPFLISLAPQFVPRLNSIEVDWPVLLFCGAAGVIVTVLFGIAPAWQSGQADPNRDLRGGGARGIVGGTSARLRQTFVTVEIALCLTLLVCSGLLLRSFGAMTSVNLGFHTDNLLAAKISSLGTGTEAVHKIVQPLLQQLSAASGVQSAAITGTLPGEARSDVSYIISGQPRSALNIHSPSADISIVSNAYFQTLGINLMDGRAFSDRDNSAAPSVVIVNQALARQSFPGTNPIGKKIFCGYDEKTMEGLTIVGVAADARLDGARQPATPEMFLPFVQFPQTDFHLLVKTSANPLIFSQPVRAMIQKLDNESTVKMTTMETHIAATMASPRFASLLISIFAGLAMLLAVAGIYGVISYSVSQRTSEIGLRMALGARQSGVLKMILVECLKLTAEGLVIGVAAAALAARFLRSQLFEVSPLNPAIYLSMVAVLITAALMAAFLPAWQASRLDPLKALRND